MGVICRNSPNKKKEKKCKFLKSLGRGYLSEQSQQKKEKKCQFWKSLEIFCRDSPTKKKEKKCQFLKSLGRDYLSEQSQQKKGEKVSILEKFRERFFVGTVPPKKKKRR